MGGFKTSQLKKTAIQSIALKLSKKITNFGRVMDKQSKHIDPSAVHPEVLAKMLGLQVQIIQKHISEGAPVAPDGTMNIITYAAWLNSRITHGS